MPTILISGANRGIGLELARQFSIDGWTVIGTARDVAAATELAALPQTSVLPLEATDPDAIAALAKTLAGQPIDVIIANAGIAINLAAKPVEVTRADFLKVVRTNTFAPLALVAALKPNLLAGQRKVALAMSSLMSSIEANNWATQYTYRASKTGLNAVMTALGPGTGSTRMPAPKAAWMNCCPGSETAGAPASDTRATSSPRSRRASNAGIFRTSLCSCRLVVGVGMV